MDDQLFDGIMDETFGPEPATEGAPESTVQDAPSAQVAAPTASPVETASTEAIDTDPATETLSATDAPSEDDSAPEPNPWDSDDNPYKQQAIEQKQRIDAVTNLVGLIQNTQQQKKMQGIIDAFPEMDETQQKQVLPALLAAVRNQEGQRSQQLAAQVEQYKEQQAVDYYQNYVSNKLGLTKDERKKLKTFTDPQAGWEWAQAAAATRKQYGGQLADAQRQLAEIRNAQAAQTRMASGVDAVGGPATSGMGSGTGRAEDATDFDDFFAKWDSDPSYARSR